MKAIRLIAAVIVVIIGVALVLESRKNVDASVQLTHAVRVGTLNGKPLFVPDQNAAAAFARQHDKPPANSPVDQQEVAAIATKKVCDSIKSQIGVAAREATQQEFRISVSHDELARVIVKTQFDATGFEKQRKQWITYNQAAAEVFDHYQDPDKVFETLILLLWAEISPGASREQVHKVWESNLVVWSTPEGRMRLAKMAAVSSGHNWNTEKAKAGMAKSMEHMLLNEKLDNAVIAKLAAEDPQFRAALDEHQRNGGIPLTAGVPITTPGLRYMSNKINEFWKSRYAQQKITLDDPKLADQCQLGSTLRVKVAGSNGI